MKNNFFIWCSGADKTVLEKCDDAVRIKHIGLGTLVLIPAVLGFISMSYALSTIDKISGSPVFYIAGGLVWGLIVFAFDRFIVSTHRKQQRNVDEFKNITFYLRLCFAVILGIVVSHPFVLLYFDGSITEKIISDRDNLVKVEERNYQQSFDTLNVRLNDIVQTKRCNEQLLTAEQSGNKLILPCGSSSGIPNINGNFPRTKEIKKIIEELDGEILAERNRINVRNDELAKLKNSSQQNIVKNTSFDYLKREIALQEIKKKNKIIGLTELLLMLAFMLVDVLPLIFKTFSPFSMYDKVMVNDAALLKELDITSRKIKLQNTYDEINGM
jgi:Domain of unknown function (DUF4407)